MQIRIDIPALDSLVAFWREQKNSHDQGIVDALTQRIKAEVIDPLARSKTALDSAVQHASEK